MKDQVFAIIFICVGLFSIFCAIKNYDWFIGNRQAWIFLKLFGRTGARIFYVVLGIFIIFCAIMMIVTG